MDIKKATILNFDTPFMVIDIENVKRNIKHFQNIANAHSKKLRPHSKTHKIPEFARLQMDLGAEGVCVQKVAEAEIMVNGGINNLLLSNEIYGTKNDRVASLLSKDVDIVLAVDNLKSASQFSDSCIYFGVEGEVLIDVDIGMERCGVDPFKFELLLEKVKKLPRISVKGIMAYDGHVVDKIEAKRRSEVLREESLITPLINKLKKVVETDPIISVGGTPTFEAWAESPIATELQPGTYIYYDTDLLRMGICSLDEIAMGIVSTVVSENLGVRYVLDAGSKSVSLDTGKFPTILDEEGNEYPVLSMSEEHTVVKARDDRSLLGKKLIMLPPHACTTTDLWDSAYIINEANNNFRLIRVEGRGKRE